MNPHPHLPPRAWAGGLGWTEERVEVLKDLWKEGLSAGQIARKLGGVTRNAVIGKIHRLGLQHRATASSPSRAAVRPPRPVVTPPVNKQRLLAARAIAEATRSVQAGPPEAPAEVVRFVDEKPGSATILTIAAHMCKWPIGDPAAEGFTLCGRLSENGSYCPEHAQVAYQPASGRKKSTAAELARSLRRYL